MDILKFPQIVNNYTSSWSVYEKSYKNNAYIDEYDFNNNDISNYEEDFQRINKIKNNFYKTDKDLVLIKLCMKLNKSYICKYQDYFKDNILSFIKSEKVNSFMYCFLNSLKYDENSIKLLTNEFTEDNFISDLKKINQIILEITKLGNMDNVINTIYYNTSDKIGKRFIDFTKELDINVLSNLLIKVNLFKKFYNNFNLDLKFLVNKIILEKIVNSVNDKNVKDNKLANSIISIFRFLLSDDLIEVKSIDLDYNLLLDYLNASIYFWILDNNYINIEILIKYSWIYFPKLIFLQFYKKHLQNRALIIRDYELENKCLNKLSDIFYEEDLIKIIYDLKYILDDINTSIICNKELFNLNVNVKYKFINTNFDLKKCNVLICSNNLWNDNKKLFNNVNYVDTISVYDCILNKFYENKYSKKRKLIVSYEESTISINLWKNNLIMPISYYNIFYKIGESENGVTLNYLKDVLNYDIEYLLKVTDIFKSNNLIKEFIELNEDVTFIINNDLENQELKISLDCIEINEKKVHKSIEYDRNLLLDSKISKLLKMEKELKYGKLLLILRNNISKYFIPSEKEILNRLERLDILGYIRKEDNLYKYIE